MISVIVVVVVVVLMTLKTENETVRLIIYRNALIIRIL